MVVAEGRWDEPAKLRQQLPLTTGPLEKRSHWSGVPVGSRGRGGYCRNTTGGHHCGRIIHQRWFSLCVLVEVVAVDPLQGIRGHLGYPDAMLDQQVCQLSPVDEDDALLDPRHVLACVAAEIRGGDQHPLAGSMTFETPSECLHHRP